MPFAVLLTLLNVIKMELSGVFVSDCVQYILSIHTHHTLSTSTQITIYDFFLA